MAQKKEEIHLEMEESTGELEDKTNTFPDYYFVMHSCFTYLVVFSVSCASKGF